MTDKLNSSPFGNSNRPIKEVQELEPNEDVKVIEETIPLGESSPEGEPVESSLVLYQLKDGSLGMQVIGEIGLKEITLFQKYLEKYSEAMWNSITDFKDTKKEEE